MKIERFGDVKGGKLGRKLANLVYDFTSVDPFCLDFGLRDRIQRAAGSVMHNRSPKGSISERLPSSSGFLDISSDLLRRGHVSFILSRIANRFFQNNLTRRIHW